MNGERKGSTSQNVKSFACDICQRSFSRKAHVQRHRYNLHIKVKPKHSCKICSSVFDTRHDLDIHMHDHFGEKPFICDVCSKAFRRKDELKRHILIHGKKKPSYTCTICSSTYSTKHDLRVHMRIHPDYRPFVCERCNKSFQAEKSLKLHIPTHEKVKPSHSCALCSSTFITKHDLRNHMKIHSNYRPFVCEICKKSFRTEDRLKRHILTHEKNKHRYSCEQCASTFKRKWDLLKHIRIDHPDNVDRSVVQASKEGEQSSSYDAVVRRSTCIRALNTFAVHKIIPSDENQYDLIKCFNDVKSEFQELVEEQCHFNILFAQGMKCILQILLLATLRTNRNEYIPQALKNLSYSVLCQNILKIYL